MNKREGLDEPYLPPEHDYGGVGSSSMFRNQKQSKELDRLLSEGEAERRQRWAANSKALDRLLITVLVLLLLAAGTRLAVWLAKVI